MALKGRRAIPDKGLARFERLYADYRKMYEDPPGSSPKFIVKTPRKRLASVSKMLDDPLLMLKDELDELRGHLRLGDDRAPTVRVQFGTAQVAAAFGCSMHAFEDSPPASSGPVMKSADEAYRMRKPPFEAGLYSDVRDFVAIWLESVPPGVHIERPDIGSPFNNAHLIRGDGIFADFREDPIAADLLLDLVTEYMVDLTKWLNQMTDGDPDWFFDKGVLHRGQACTTCSHTPALTPELYAGHVLLRDMRFMRAIGGGCVCYRGASGEVIGHLLRNPDLTGLDFDLRYHDLWELAEKAPERVTLLTEIIRDSDTYEGLVAGNWPRKRNIVLCISATSAKEGKTMLADLRRSVPGGAG